MAFIVQVDVTEVDGKWGVDVTVDGRPHDRLEATTKEEARLMHADILAIAKESGGELAFLEDYGARRN